MTTILLLALAGTVLATIIGTIWYSPGTPMGRLHMRSIGFDRLSSEEQKSKMEEMKPRMWRLYAGQMALSFLTSFAVAFIVTMSMQNGLTLPMALGFVAFNWLAFMVPVSGASIIWGNVDRAIAWRKFASDALSYLTTVLAVALLAGLLA